MADCAGHGTSGALYLLLTAGKSSSSLSWYPTLTRDVAARAFSASACTAGPNMQLLIIVSCMKTCARVSLATRCCSNSPADSVQLSASAATSAPVRFLTVTELPKKCWAHGRLGQPAEVLACYQGSESRALDCSACARRMHIVRRSWDASGLPSFLASGAE